MQLIISGATGQVGSGLLCACLTSPRITKLSILSRRAFELPTGPGLDVSKATIIVHKDFLNYPSEVLEQLKGATGAVWALGISQTKVSREDYIVITHDYAMAAAKAFATLCEKPFKFIYVSGEGADQNGQGYTFFSNIKGRTDVELLSLTQSSNRFSGLRIYISTGRVSRSIQKILYTPLIPLVLLPMRLLMPRRFISKDQLASAMLDLALRAGEPLPGGPGIENDGRLVRNSAMREWELNQ
ncbi:hypothetical protein BKA62DRAFT_749897 [Auriculariales sp. MPI-PUGE-AT-0066]|nr:hypothetical protein BKA62DRAFT_749897 [Auriculariales sp. MPI-PUGE-AT-0066]